MKMVVYHDDHSLKRWIFSWQSPQEKRGSIQRVIVPCEFVDLVLRIECT